MVSQVEARAPSRDRLLAAAAAEFAARGFDGAKVDRIATRARANKAMIYYHFKSKAALYREVLRDVFGAVAAAVAAVRDAGSPETQIRRFVEAVADLAIARPYFPAMWLREIAEGGRHVDAPLVAQIGRIMQTLAAILADGRRAGVFADTHPFVVQIGIVGPLMFFAATSRVRERYSHRTPFAFTGVSREAVVAHVQAMTLAALAVKGQPAARRQASTRRQRR